jgi:radical SAM family RiPP maturation amino acid epimerase
MSALTSGEQSSKRRFWMPPSEGAAAIFHDWRHSEKELNTIFAQDPRFHSIIDPKSADSVPYRSELAQTKRFEERLRCDRVFRERLAADPVATVKAYGLEVDAEALRPFWDDDVARNMAEDPTFVPALPALRHRLFAREKLLHREKTRAVECMPSDERHRSWRERQIKRCLGELGPALYRGIVHAPFAIELSDGCSVGCWFCAVSAEKKKSDFLYTAENGVLWREILQILRSKIGPAAGTGFCYWATDPLDNPDYERFCTDFAEICGRFPQTTTAQPHKDPERVRALLSLSQDLGCTINRFSILTLRIFDRIMDAFSAEELLHCELVPQNPEAVMLQSEAGRAYKSSRLDKRKEMSGWAADAEAQPGTIACISGFLINMVTRKVRLISPCAANERWPDGYWVIDEGSFTDALSFEQLIEQMMADHMRTSIRTVDSARLRKDVELEMLDDGFAVQSWGSRTAFRGPAYLGELGRLLKAGGGNAGDLALQLEKRLGLPLHMGLYGLNELFDAGVLDEEPKAPEELAM